MARNRLLRTLLGSIFLLMVVAACGSPKKAVPTAAVKPAVAAPAVAPAQKGKVVIYTSIYQELLDMLQPALQAKFPELEVEFVTKGGTEHLIAKIESEFNAGIAGADAIMLADPAYTRILKSEGKLLPYKPANFDKVKVDRDADGHYTGVRVIDVVIIYNTDLVRPEQAPKSFKDLLDPKWNGQVAMPDPTKSGSTMATVAALVQNYGWDYFKGAEANRWQIGGSSSKAPQKVFDGKAKVGIAVEQQYLVAKKEGKPVGMVWPADGTIVLESPFAILKNAGNVAGAKQVADWLFTPEAQAIIARGEMHPVIPGVAPVQGSVSLEELVKRSMQFDWDRFVKERDDITRQISGVVTIRG